MTSTSRSLRMPTMSAVGPGRLLDDLAEVLAEAVVGHAALDRDAQCAGPAGRRRCCWAWCRSPRTGPCRPCSCRCRRRPRTRCRGRGSRRGRRASAPGRSRPSWRSRSSSGPGRGCWRSCRRRRWRRGSCRRRGARRPPRCCPASRRSCRSCRSCSRGSPCSRYWVGLVVAADLAWLRTWRIRWMTVMVAPTAMRPRAMSRTSDGQVAVDAGESTSRRAARRR